jgi:predicted metalloprotease with PDZ domain
MRHLVLVVLLAGCPKSEPPTAIEKISDPIAATSTGTIDHRITFPERQAHYVSVEATFPVKDRSELTVMMPVWIPGSYLVREYAKNVHDFTARGSAGPLRATKTQKNRWRIELDGSPFVAIRYRLYANQANVRDNYVDRELAVLNGPPTFLADADHLDRPHRITLELPQDWKTAVSPLSEHQGAFVARNFDDLVDSPIVAGNPAIHRFEIEGVEHLLVNTEEGALWDGPRSAEDAEKIAREVIRFWGTLPYSRYIYFNVMGEGGGGIEHARSTLITTPRWRMRDEDEYRGWLVLLAHEHFHAWNGKRLRPIALGPFDYERENYTRDLWIVEGLTSYYDDLLLVRAAMMTEEQFLSELSGRLEAVELAPGRLHDSLAAASFDAWIEYYRWDENSNNTTISYYDKGSVVGFLLDADIRRATNSRKSLDDVMREAYRLFSAESGYRSDDFYRLVGEVGGLAVRDRLMRMVETTKELDYEPAFDWYGLDLEPPEDPKSKAYLGVRIERENGRSIVVEVLDRGPAYEAGIGPKDEIIAIDGQRIRNLDTDLTHYRPDDRVKVLIARRGAIKEIEATLGEKPKGLGKLRPEVFRSEAQIERFQALIEPVK